MNSDFNDSTSPSSSKGSDTRGEVITKQVRDQIILSIRFKGKYNEIGDYYSKLYKVAARLSAGAPFALYHDEGYKAEDADIEACIPIRKNFEQGEWKSKVLKGGKFISIIHKGSYDTLHEAYAFITDYAKENEIKLNPPAREIYLKGPRMIFKRKPQHYVTEVQYCIDKHVVL